MTAAEQLREKARGYRLNEAAAAERGEPESALAFKIVALVLLEVAEVFDREEAEAA